MLRNLCGMSIKETQDYIAVDCGLPADTFNVITLLNNHLTVGIEKLYKEVDYYNQKNFPMSVWLWDEEQERDIKSKLNKNRFKRSGAKYCDGSRLKTISPTINMPVSFTIQQASSPAQIKNLEKC